MPLRRIGELVISSSLDRLAEVDEYTENLFKQWRLSPTILDDVAISVSEAVNNAILHGNKLDVQKKVQIRFYQSSRFLRLVVQDEGGGFTPEAIPDPRAQQNLLKSSGRGVLIMRHLMDRVVFRNHRGGMQIVMDKFLPKESHVH